MLNPYVILSFCVLVDHSRTTSQWDELNGVLITTDKALSDTNIRDARFIINYSIPGIDYMDLLRRFSTMLNYYESFDPKVSEY